MPVGTESPPALGKVRLQVGDWAVEPALNQLSAAGKIVKLEPKAMAVLVYLAERPGQVVSREELLSAVWPGLVVGDDSLTQVVIKVRRAMGNAPEEPAYIQTISKGGYRLVAPVVQSAEISSTPVRPDSVPRYSDHKRSTRWLAAAGIAALAFVAAGIWWLKGERATGAAPDQTPLANIDAARTGKPTVAIRPFEALGNDPQEMLLARGITADLATDLSKVSGLLVIGAEPAGRVRSDDPAVRYLVSGTIQRTADRLRLHVHLTDAENGQQLWSERYDRELTDLFAIQDELARKILGVLPMKVSDAEMRRVAHRYTRNLEAFQYFQRGQAALLVRRKLENETARSMFRQAIALDAAFARAYAGLALTHAADYRNQWTVDGNAALGRAFEMASTARQIDPDIPETYWVLAYVHAQRREHQQALQHLEAAVQLYPSFADGYALMGGINTYIGRPAETVPLLRTAMRLNPDAGYLYFLLLGRAYLFLGNLEQARVNLEHALARNPENLEARAYLAVTHITAGNRSAAEWEADEIRALQPGFSVGGWLETYPMTDDTQKTKLMQALGGLGF
jgi:TolB-like protein/DNA-binding winged helix-turn-helix (wHTH) protein